jgi:predicted PurR-regulated permease PerM
MNEEPTEDPSRHYLRWFVLVLSVVVFLPLVFQPQFRKLIALALLGFGYSIFIVSTWKRWVRQANRLNQDRLGGLIPLGFLRKGLKVLPIKAWGLVPCVIQLIVVGVISICVWFLGPVIYKVLRNPATPGILRDALQSTAPDLFRFLNALASNQDPVRILRENAQQIFTNFNQFLSAFVFPVMFIAFTAVGASLHRAVERLFMRAEGKDDGTYSKILNEYSVLFLEYISFNLLYYCILSLAVGLSLGILDFYDVTSFGWKLIAGVLVSFVAGNLIIPGLGTLIMTGLVVGMLFAEAGWFIAGLFLLIFGIYILLDDYLIKPFFLVWMGGSPGRNWEFGVEIIIFGFVVLYSTFGLIGVLLLFPALCFLSAYLRDQYPELRPWILRPIQHLRQ